MRRKDKLFDSDGMIGPLTLQMKMTTTIQMLMPNNPQASHLLNNTKNSNR